MSQIVSRLDLTGTRSEGDRKEYQLIKLQNGLECLLISTFREQMAFRRPSSVMTEEQEDKLRKASIPDRRFTTPFEQSRSVRTFSEERLKASLTESTEKATRHDSKEIPIEEENEEDDEDDDDVDRRADDEENRSEREDEVGHSPLLGASTVKSISARQSMRDSSSKASGMGVASSSTHQARQPSVTGVVSGEAGRKLSQIFPSLQTSPMSSLNLPESPYASSGLAGGIASPSTPQANNSNSNLVPPPPPSSVASIMSRTSIIMETPRERPPGLRLSRLLGGSQSDFNNNLLSPHGHSHGESSGNGPLASPSSTDLLSPTGSNAAGGMTLPARTHRTSIRSNSMASSRAHSLVYPPAATADSSDTCAVAMAVAVGSFATPDGLDGLAHFLEHMLFMGSEKFPRENEFDSVLARAGGSSNAYTDTERTMYHFAVPQMHLRECLRVFTQFFVSPLLLPEASLRELKSIESEFALRQNIDGCRLQEIWRETSRPDTPYSKFTCGNMHTLKDNPEKMGINVNQSLKEFYEKYYVSGNMRFVIISGESMSELESSVCELLKEVRAGPPSTNLSLAHYGFPWKRHNPFSSKPASPGAYVPPEPGVAAGCCFRVPPTHDMHEMQLTWQLPPQSALYKSKPTEYVAHALGHESAGSVLAELKSRGWATALMAGVSPEDGFTNNTGVTLFNVTISLTSAGLSQWIFVAGLVFEFIGILKRTGPVKWIYDELKEVAAMQYRFHEEPDSRWMAQRLCVHMLPHTGFDKDHLLTGASLVFEWNPDAITAVLERLEPESVRVDLISSRLHEPPLDTSGSNQQQDDLLSLTLCQRPQRAPILETYTGAQYWVDPIPQPVLYSWRAVLTGKSTVGYAGGSGEETFPKALSLPPRNPFISTDFKIKSVRKYDTTQHFLVGAEFRVKCGVAKNDLNVLLKIGENAPVPPPVVAVVGNPSNLTPTNAATTTTTGGTGATNAITTTTTPHTSTKHISFGNLGKTRKSIAQWDLAIVIAVDVEGDAVLMRYPAKEGVRKWHKFDAPFSLSASTQLAPGDFNKTKPFLMDNGKTIARLVSNLDTVSVGTKATVDSQQKLQSDQTREEYDEVAELFPAGTTDGKLLNMWVAFPRVPPYESCPQPALVSGSDDFFSLWYLHDTRFHSPRVSAYLSFLTPIVAESALNAALADLFAVLVFESLNQESYMAFIVDLDFEIQVTPGLGLQLHFSGFSHKLPDLLRIVLRRTFFFTQWVASQGQPTMPTATSPRESFFKRKSTAGGGGGGSKGENGSKEEDENEFDAFFLAPDQDAPREFDTPIFFARLEALLTDYINAGSRFRSGSQISSVMFDLLCVGTWTPDEKALAARTITPQMLIDFANKIFATTKVEGLFQGNVDEKDAAMFFKCVESALRMRGSKPIKSGMEPKLRSHVLPVVSEKNQPVSGWVHILEAVESPSHSVELFFQIGPDNPEDRVLASAIEQLMREPLYSELRTKQQLGYSVKCGVRSVCGTIGFVVEITSDIHGPEVLAADVDEFFVKMRAKIEQMPQEEFILNLCGLANQFLEKAKNLAEASARHWNCILSHAFYGMPYVWNSNIIDAAMVKAVCTKSRVLDAFTDWLDPSMGKRRRASVFVVGYGYQVDRLVKALKRPCVKLLAHPHGNVGTKLSNAPGANGASNKHGNRRSSMKCTLM